MEKMVLADGTELEIQDGASVHGIEMQVADYAALGALATKLTKENLSKVEFRSGDQITGEYGSMILNEPHFLITQKTGYLSVTIGLREMTQGERQQEDVQTAIFYLTDEQAVSVIDLHPEWEPSKAYKAGERKKYKGELYRCLQDHTSQAAWTPEAAPSLWAKVLIPDPEVVPQWEQPESTNGYETGDRVTHNGATWESLVDNNVWEPGAAGTETIWKKMEE